MQMHSVETKAGTAISCAPSRIACTSPFFIDACRWTFSMVTVASSTRMPTASAMPPSVIRLSVCPRRCRTVTATRSESGIDTRTMSVLRQLPRKSIIIIPVSAAALSASRRTRLTAARAKTDRQRIFLPAHLHGAAREDEVLRVDRVRHVARREPERVQLLQVQVDHDLALFSADRQRQLRAVDGGEAGAEEVAAQIEELLLAE